MPWSGGSFTRTNGVHTGATLWAQDRDAGTKILAARHDTHDQDLAGGINSTLEKSGSNAATGNLNIGSNRLTAVADGTAKTDAATVNQIQSNAPAYQATDTGTANAHVIALSPAITAYASGQKVTFKSGSANTTASTLNVNGLGVKAIKKLHDQDVASGDIESGSIVTAVYDGTNFQMTSQIATSPAAGVTLSGSTNNTVATVTGANALIGEANLTFDGSQLLIPNGSAGAPSNSFINSTGTGLYFVSPDMHIGVDGVFSASFTDDASGLGNRILFGKTSEGDVATAGWDFAGTPSTQSNAYGTSLSSQPLLLNRQNNDGTLIDFQQANSTEGTISVSGTTVSYNGAHLSRWSQLADNAKTEIPRGTVMSGIDEMCQWWMESWTDTTLVKGGVVVPREKISSMKLSLGLADGDSYEDEEGDTRTISLKENNQLTRCKISDAESDKAVLGVFEKYESDTEAEKNYNDLVIAQSGDYVIRVGSDFDGQVGDLLESAGDGTAKIQSDDIVRSKTVARVTGSTKIHEYADGSFAVPCILMIA